MITQQQLFQPARWVPYEAGDNPSCPFNHSTGFWRVARSNTRDRQPAGRFLARCQDVAVWISPPWAAGMRSTPVLKRERKGLQRAQREAPMELPYGLLLQRCG